MRSMGGCLLLALSCEPNPRLVGGDKVGLDSSRSRTPGEATDDASFCHRACIVASVAGG